jgi:hypothetical protein
VWPEPVNRELFARLVAPHLAALAAAGQEITDARKAPDKVGGAASWLVALVLQQLAM